MAKRPSTKLRGYGIAHQRLRAHWSPYVDRGQVSCWRCGRPIPPGQAWHLGHDDYDRTHYRGPEHVRCNVGAANKRKARTKRSRVW